MTALGMTGNWFAAFALLAWPLVAIALYRTKPAAEATLWTLLGGFLLLPTGVFIKLPMIPAIDKSSVPNLCALVGCLLAKPRRRQGPTALGLVEVLILMLIVGPMLTGAFNNDIIVIGDRVLPGVGYYDGFSSVLTQAVIFLPFLLGRRFLQEAADAETVVRCLTIAGLFYSFPMLLEIRLSPQLSNWIYGFFPAGFSNEMRYGGFRPVVFMTNGLAAAFFMMTTFLASMAMWRIDRRLGLFPSAGVSAYLAAIVGLCKSAGALIYAVVGGLFVRWMNPKMQLRLALVLACIGTFYPILRATDTFPDQILIDVAAEFNQARADSLKFRFDQERQLLDRASQRFAFGWGRYGRSRVYEESGKDSSITDGGWIIVAGQFGLVGFLAQFGLLALPVFRAVAAYKFVKTERERIILSVIALIVALGIIEQLPNASISSWSWLLAGSLLGRTECIIANSRKRRSQGHSRMSAIDSGPANA